MPLALETIVKQLTDSGIIAQGKLENYVPPKAYPKDAEELLRELHKQKLLTKFQAQQVAAGKTKALILGEYTILDKIGAGGMGQVFKAEHRRMKRQVAIKMLPPTMTKDGAALARFQREVEAAAKLSHPNIVHANDAGQSGNTHFLVMEYVEGSDLSALVKKNGPLSVEKALDCILQAAKGLEYAHRRGVIHRDIKPANLLLDAEGTVKILDMGLARIESGGDAATQAELTGTGAVMGTIDYMAPEQARSTHHADARADIYSLGCSLFYLLAGRPLYAGDTITNKLISHQFDPIPSFRETRDDVPEQLEAIYQKMVAKKVEDRYQSMSEVIADMQPLAAGSTMMGSTLGTTDAATSNSNLTFLNEIPAHTAQRKSTKQIKAIDGSGSKNKKLALIGGGIFGILVLVAAIIVSLRTKDGTLIVEVDQPDATVQVLDAEGKVEVSQKGGGKITIGVDPGKHRLRVEKEGFVVFGQEFEMEKGGTKAIVAKLLSLDAVARTDNLALDFDGTGYVKTPIRYLGHYPITIEAWIRRRGSARTTVISDEEDSTGGFTLETVGGTGQLAVMSRSLPKVTGSRSAIEHETVHIAGTIAESECRLFINGKFQGSSPAQFVASKYNLFIGGNPGGTGASKIFDGTIDEVRISKTARYTGNFTPEPRFIPDADTIALYHFDEGSGDTAFDSSSNKHHAKIVGAKWVRAGSSVVGPLAKAPLQTIDLLASVDVARDTISGIWKKEGTSLIVSESPGTPAKLKLFTPKPMPDEYDVEVEVERKRAGGMGGVFGFLTQGHQATVNFDLGRPPHGWAIEEINRKPSTTNSTYTVGQRLPLNQRKAVQIKVRRGGVSVYLESERIIDWQGKPEELSVNFWKVPDTQTLFLGSHGDFVFHKLTLTKVSSVANRTAAPPLAKAPFDAAQAKAHQEAWARHLGIKVETPNSVGQTMILIPPGEFLMGSTDKQVEEALKVAEGIKADSGVISRIEKAERPQHEVVIIKPLLMSATEVTIVQFKKFAATGYVTEAEAEAAAKASPSTPPTSGQPPPKPIPTYLNPGYAVTDHSPATVITWNDAVAYCKWLSEQEKTTYRLPTEAEWEYACRAGTTTQYSFGDDYNELPKYGWHNKNAGGKSHPVGTLLANPFGLFDMHGNLQEWCGDYFDEKWYSASTPNDPNGPGVGSNCVIRGGHWYLDASACRSASRSNHTPSSCYTKFGFRCVSVLDAPSTTASVTPQPTVPTAAPAKPLTDFNSPEFLAWMKEAQAMPAEEQVQAVSKKLVELNPGFDGKVTGNDGKGTPKIENGVVTELSFIVSSVTDISPVRAFVGLRYLRVVTGRLSELLPLQGMQLSTFNGFNTQISDLSPLQGMPLTYLNLSGTQISELSPLQGMPLRTLDCFKTRISDLSPLEDSKSLTTLNVTKTQVTPAAVAALQKALPNCKILWDDPAKATTPQPAASGTK